MKFTDGYWQMRPGVTPHYPAQVHEVQVEPDALKDRRSSQECRGPV